MPRNYRHSSSSAKKKFPYWKVQYYDSVTLCWGTVPKVCSSIKLAEAIARRLPVPRVRLIRIEESGDQILLPEIQK